MPVPVVEPQRKHDGLYHVTNPLLDRRIENFFFGDYSYIKLQGVDQVFPWHKSTESARRIIERNNTIAELMQKPEFLQVLEKEKEIKGPAKVGEVFCVDGRLPIIHIAGRNVSVWEEGAGLLATVGHDGVVALQSQLFLQNLASAAGEDRDLLEIFPAHTSFSTDHKCGRMAGVVKELALQGIVSEDVDPVALNIKLLDEQQIPAVESAYNRFRKMHGKPELRKVAVSGVIDTDTLGLMLNYEGLEQGRALFTSDILREFLVEPIAGKKMLTIDGKTVGSSYVYGAMKDTFTKPENFIHYYKSVVSITQRILQSSDFEIKVGTRLNELHPDLTEDQQRALRFVFARTMSMQYLVGSLEMHDNHPNHPFGEHAEGYIAVSQDGKTMGRFDPEEQVFGTSASSVKGAVDHIVLEEGIMRGNKHEGPVIVYLSKPVDGEAWRKHLEPGEGEEQIRRAIASNQTFLLDVLRDEKISSLMDQNRVVVIPTITDQDTGEVLDVPDSSEVLKQLYILREQQKTAK